MLSVEKIARICLPECARASYGDEKIRGNNAMLAQPHGQRVSVEEYFEFLRAQPEGRYEYIDGVISPAKRARAVLFSW